MQSSNKLATILSALSLLGVIVLGILYFTGGHGSKATKKVITSDGKEIVISDDDSTSQIEFPAKYKIVYINTDSLWENYEFMKESKKKLEATEKQMRAQYQGKYDKMKADYEFYMKGSQNGILTKTQMAQKEASLKMQEQEIMELDNQLSSKLMKMQEDLNIMVKDTIQAFINRYRIEKDFTLIIQYGYLSALLSGDQSLDVTPDALRNINKEYYLRKANGN